MGAVSDDQGLVFLSYVRDDESRVTDAYDFLTSNGFNVWFDRRRLRPGSDWEFEIRRALDKASVIVVFLSHNSVDHRGYGQREIRIALAKAQEKLSEDIYIIPVLLDDDVEVPADLMSKQYVKASEAGFQEQIADSIRYQLGRLDVQLSRVQREGEVRWTMSTLREAWEGLPGYDVEIQLIEVRSEKWPMASEIGDYIRGDLLRNRFSSRTAKLSQDPSRYDFGQDEFRRTSTFSAQIAETTITGRTLSVRYSVSWYGAGAAHPNYHFQTYVFLIDPVIHVKSLRDMFVDDPAPLAEVQSIVREQLSRIRIPVNPSGDTKALDSDWIARGTDRWDSFDAFWLGSDGVEINFAPYQVGPFAYGGHTVEIPYGTLAPLMRREYLTRSDCCEDHGRLTRARSMAAVSRGST